MKVLVKFPSRGRPEVFQRTFLKWRKDLDCRILVTMDTDDHSCNNPSMHQFLDRQLNTSYEFGSCKSKIQAINHGLKNEEFDLLIVAHDDVIPTRKDYVQRIVRLFQTQFANGDGCLHLNDDRQGQKLDTQAILDRRYFDRTGYVYHPDYVSLFCDQEYTEVGQILGRSRYVDEVILQHQWMDVTGDDKLHQHNDSFFDQDHQTYQRRKILGFPMESVRS